jgi:AbrB family looped-hinge helix DNA binding protein
MVTRSATLKDRGQVTVPVEIRRNHELHAGSRLVFEDRGDYIALIPADKVVDRTAGALAKYAKDRPSMTPSEMREVAADAIAEENLETLERIEREHAGH